MDDVTIANRCLAAIGTRSAIQSLTEASAEAAAVNLVFHASARELQTKFSWNWNKKQSPLALLKSRAGTPTNPTGALPQPPTPYLYEYQLPSDCLQPRYIVPILSTAAVVLTSAPQVGVASVGTPPIKFFTISDDDPQGNMIVALVTNQNQAELVYSRYVSNPNLWDDLFITALIGRIAPQIAPQLTGDKSLVALAIKRGAQAEMEAEISNGNQEIFLTTVTPDWLNARGDIDGDEDPYSFAGNITVSPS